MALTERQKKLRRYGVGASEIAVLAGLSRWATPIQIYQAKVRGRDLVDSYAADLGTELEAPIARVWAKQEGRFLARVDTLQHPTKPFALATPDRAVYLTAEERGDARKLRTYVADAERLLQVKSTNWRMRRFWGDQHSDEIPAEYLAQAHWEGSVAGVETVDFAVDFDKTQLFRYRVIVSPRVFEPLYEVAERFMIDHVLPEVPPPPDSSEQYADFLRDVFPRPTRVAWAPLVPEHEPEVWQAVQLFAKCKAAASRLKALTQLARNTIEARIGENEAIGGPWGWITWKAQKPRTVVNWQACADEYRNLAALVLQAQELTAEDRARLVEQLAGILPRHTKEGPIIRVLRPTWRGALAYETERIELQLEALQKGLDSAEEVDPDSVEAPQSNPKGSTRP